MSYVVVIEGLDRVVTADQIDSAIVKNAMKAINKTTDRARAASAREIEQQVAFPAGYLNDGRLAVSRYANRNTLEAAIMARARPTSLARFVNGSPPTGKMGLNVTVDPGVARYMSRAFLMKLKAGSGIETKSNLGLAVRTSKKPPDKAWRPVKINESLWLLYGPSVDQIFKGVANDLKDETTSFLETEFNRLMLMEDFDG